MFRRLTLLILFAAAWFGQAPTAQAAAGEWRDEAHSQVRLISASRTTGGTETLSFGLHFKLEDGWKVYWRSAGDAGYAPRLDWTGSQNIAGAEMRWPAPSRFTVLGFNSQGYKKEVVLPITVTPDQPGKPITAELNLDYLTCNDVCIPVQTKLSLALTGGPAIPSEHAHLISRFQSLVPGDGRAVGLKLDGLSLYPPREKDGPALLRIQAETLDGVMQTPDAFVEGPVALEFAKPAVRLAAAGKQAVVDMPVYGLKYFKGDLADETLTVTFVDGARALEAALKPDARAAWPADAAIAGNSSFGHTQAGEGLSIVVLLAMAVLGGLILNLMPCVLPVLSIKLLGVVSHGGAEKNRVRLIFLASSAGILASFLGLAAVLAALQAAGGAIGWGIQFQHPWFLIALTVLVTGFACNLWGFFEIRLPDSLADAGARASGGGGLTGHFLTGAFATLLATPCSAPFLGTAVGFALSKGMAEIFLIFTGLGIGLALPYLVVAAAPGLVTRLPKPGPWMVKLKVVLGFALAGTGVWLISVLAADTGWPAAFGVLALMIWTTGLLWLSRQTGSMRARAAGVAVALLAFAVPSLAPDQSVSQPVVDRSVDEKIKGIWTPFNEAEVRTLITQGKVVFVDVTADWCITCQVNKRVVLGQDAVFSALTQPPVVPMQADWTLPNDAIAEYLAKNGRYAIPFNAVYGPGAPKGILLPELLDAEGVLAALKQAATRREVSKH